MAGLFSRLFGRSSAAATPASGGMVPPLGSIASASGLPVSQATAMTVSAVYASARILSSDVARCRPSLYRRLPDGSRLTIAAKDHPVARLLRRPNRVQTWYEFTRDLIVSYPVKKSTQIPVAIYDTTSTNLDCSYVMLTEMDEAMVLDSMQLELAVSREGTYIDGGGNTVSAFQVDQTLIRAIAEHDFQMRHAASVAVIQFVRWAPAIS